MSTKELRRKYIEDVEKEVKNTVGYHEAENKKSFMDGVLVALNKIDSKYEKYLTGIESKLRVLESSNKEYKDDLTTLTSIISKHSDRVE